MNSSTCVLLVIITEASLESTLERDFEQLGAKGYTITDARGSGKHGVRSAEWDADRNIHIEVICSDETATKITEHLTSTYFEHYAMTMYSHNVNVVRSSKF